MKITKILLSILALLMFFNLLGCGGGGESSSSDATTGTLAVGITDAPLVDEDNVTGVFISVLAVQYHGNGGWHTLNDFNDSVNPINLLDLQDGTTLALANVDLPAGKYTQIRFLLDAAEENKGPKSNTGCFIQFDGDRNETLYVPSGSQTGYKAIGNFNVAANQTVSITADFDVRKSVVVSGDHSYYKLKPTIRLIVDNQAGEIKGTVTNLTADRLYVIYAYESSDFVDVPAEVANDFENAVTSATLKEGGSYTLAFLGEGDYDLVIAEYDTNGDYIGHNIQLDVNVQSGQTTTFDFSL